MRLFKKKEETALPGEKTSTPEEAYIESAKCREIGIQNIRELIKTYLDLKNRLLDTEPAKFSFADSKIDSGNLEKVLSYLSPFLEQKIDIEWISLQEKLITIINNLYNRQFQYLLTINKKNFFYIRVRRSKNDLEYNPYEYAIQLLKTVVGITEFFSYADDKIKGEFSKPLLLNIHSFIKTLLAVIKGPRTDELPFDTRLLKAGQTLIQAIKECFLTQKGEDNKTILEHYGITCSEKKLQTLFLYFRDLCLWSKAYKFDPVINIEKRQDKYFITETHPIILDESVFTNESKEWLKKTLSSFSQSGPFKALIEKVVNDNWPSIKSNGRTLSPSFREAAPSILANSRVVFTGIIDQTRKKLLVFNSITLSGSLSPPFGTNKLQGITSSLPQNYSPSLHATHLAFQELLFNNSSLAHCRSLFESLYSGFTSKPKFIFVEIRLLTGKMFENSAMIKGKLDDNNFAMADNARNLAKAIQENPEIKSAYLKEIQEYYKTRIGNPDRCSMIEKEFFIIPFNWAINSKADEVYATSADATSKNADIRFTETNTQSLKIVIKQLIDFLGENGFDNPFIQIAEAKCESFSLQPKKIRKKSKGVDEDEVDEVMDIQPTNLMTLASKISLSEKLTPIIKSPPQFSELIKNELIYRIQSMAFILSLPDNPKFRQLKPSQKNLIFAALTTLLIGNSGFVDAGCKSARDRTFLLLLGRYLLLADLEQFFDNPEKIIRAIEKEIDNLFPIQASYGLVPAFKAADVNPELEIQLGNLNENARIFHLVMSKIVRKPMNDNVMDLINTMRKKQGINLDELALSDGEGSTQTPNPGH